MDEATQRLLGNVTHWKRTIQQRTTPADFTTENYNAHAYAIKEIGDALLAKDGKEFIVDENNRHVMKFLLLYFNGSRECENVFPGKGHSLNKNILLMGPPGTGKTLIMQVFSEYLKRSQNDLFFKNIGATELLNYQKVNGHINLFTYNAQNKATFEGSPVHLCLNDIGISTENQKSFGTDLGVIIDEFLYARYEIWTNKSKRYHITTNMGSKDFKNAYDARLVDRMKAFNELVLVGKSRR